MTQLGIFLKKFVLKAEKKVVLMIDEVDKSSNYDLFLTFLGLLRAKYISRNAKRDFTFHSVILAGIHDIKNLKERLRPDKEKHYDSPWNIAADLDVSLTFQPEEIAKMLQSYTEEKQVSMNISEMGKKLFNYTSGYPTLVSHLCKIMDEDLMQKDSFLWDSSLLEKSVHQLLQKKTPNFETLIKNLKNNPDLSQLVESIVLEGRQIDFNQYQTQINHGIQYGFFRNQEGLLQIHNKIYEQQIYKYLSLDFQIQEMFDQKAGNYYFQEQFYLEDGTLNLEKVLEKFQVFMKKEYSKKDNNFLERNARLIFFAFLKPIINGKGFDFKEVTISEEKRLDIAITYLHRKYVVELKLWRGKKQHEKGLQQLADYLERQNLSEGFLLIFDITKKQIKAGNQKKETCEEKEISIFWV